MATLLHNGHRNNSLRGLIDGFDYIPRVANISAVNEKPVKVALNKFDVLMEVKKHKRMLTRNRLR